MKEIPGDGRGTHWPGCDGTGRGGGTRDHLLPPSETILAINIAALVCNGNYSADSGFPSPSEYRSALLEKEGLGHFGSVPAFWC